MTQEIVQEILVLPGDGIGAEIMPHAIRLMEYAAKDAVQLQLSYADIGGGSIDRFGVPVTDEVLEKARSVVSVLLGAVGGPQWDDLEADRRPERGLLDLRSAMECYANLRPAVTFEPLLSSSSLRTELVQDLDILIIRELTGGIYFGEPRGIHVRDNVRKGFNTLVYDEEEIARIARVAFELAKNRNGRVCSVDKANVLEVTQLWRTVVSEVHESYPDVELSHMYVDNAAMQLVRNPKQFDVLVTGNMFGDILSDIAAMLTGSLGMLPSASIGDSGRGLYEPVHGTAPDIAGQNLANPLATILSVAMMFRYSMDEPKIALRIEEGVRAVLDRGLRTGDIMPIEHNESCQQVGTVEMVDAVIDIMEQHS